MANGDIFGLRRRYGTVMHSDGSPTLVLSVSFEDEPEGYWHFEARVLIGGSNSTAGLVGRLIGRVYKDGGDMFVTDVNFSIEDEGMTGYDATLDALGEGINVMVEAAANRRTTVLVEYFGVEQAITLA